MPFPEMQMDLKSIIQSEQIQKKIWNINTNMWSLPWRQKWQPTPVFLPGEFHGWKSLVGYSPCDRKELDTTEQMHWLVIHTDMKMTILRKFILTDPGGGAHEAGPQGRNHLFN